MISDKEFIDLERRIREIERRLHIPVTREEKIEEVKNRRHWDHIEHMMELHSETSKKDSEEMIKQLRKVFKLDD